MLVERQGERQVRQHNGARSERLCRLQGASSSRRLPHCAGANQIGKVMQSSMHIWNPAAKIGEEMLTSNRSESACSHTAWFVLTAERRHSSPSRRGALLASRSPRLAGHRSIDFCRPAAPCSLLPSMIIAARSRQSAAWAKMSNKGVSVSRRDLPRHQCSRPWIQSQDAAGPERTLRYAGSRRSAS